jgi:hypothetical protein
LDKWVLKIKSIKRIKYRTVKKRETSVKGEAAEHLPNQVNKTNTLIKHQKMKRLIGEYIEPLKRWLDPEMENRNKRAIDITKPITPPSLLGIHRRIAYANKKYHSGWIWVGVTRELAGMKLAASIKK